MDRIPKDLNILSRFTCKDVAYEHEREIRAIFMDPVVPGSAPSGHLIAVDLDPLVERVAVSPLSPSWFYDLVKSVCVRFECNADVGRPLVPVY
jgi:hypothetical protein